MLKSMMGCLGIALGGLVAAIAGLHHFVGG
jgi:hypothetical protein